MTPAKGSNQEGLEILLAAEDRMRRFKCSSRRFGTAGTVKWLDTQSRKRGLHHFVRWTLCTGCFHLSVSKNGDIRAAQDYRLLLQNAIARFRK